ncbi:MAG TPA: adenosylcobalamin-dependent ribonucleoside-diphosphate reductase [Bryobacteraceae bacterium]|nr:adenosylcobalamin-dependent ribonucleoside-diphosphate reductase [Bryobacteraceae bacterium]
MLTTTQSATKISENGLRVLQARYLRRNCRGDIIETPPQLFRRVAEAIAEAELLHGNGAEARRWEERFHEMISNLDFLPNSPTLMNAGTPSGQLSACFVLPVEDTMESIFGTLRDAALIQRTGGGTGFSFSNLRPAGDIVQSTGGVASGPVSFMKIYDCATENIKLGGRRRGANMGILRADHPDIEEFVNAKRDGHSFRNFNISVSVPDEFMQAVDFGTEWVLRHPEDGRPVRRIAARRLFEEICEAAWATGDPGLIFSDAIARGNQVPLIGEMEATNPCGELPLFPHEACNLGSINLTHFASESGVAWERLGEQVRDAVRFLDDVISINNYPLEKVERTTLANRKIGLGVMGFAELCIQLRISYASEQAVTLADELMRFIARGARRASMRLAQERGVFPNWRGSVYECNGIAIRNATQTSIAPTGTISIIAGTSSGIEPLFGLAYRRHVLSGETQIEFNPLLLRHAERLGAHARDILDTVTESGRLASGDPEKLFVTALEVPPEQHVRIQAAFQKHVDNAVSKTVNLPVDASPEDVRRVYRLAHELGCKGITVFRYGSSSEQVLELGARESVEEKDYFTRCDPGACRL